MSATADTPAAAATTAAAAAAAITTTAAAVAIDAIAEYSTLSNPI